MNNNRPPPPPDAVPLGQVRPPPPPGAVPLRSQATPSVQGVNDSLSWGDVAAGAITNAPASAKNFVGDIASVVTDPIGTAKNVGKLGLGGIEKLIPGEQGHEQYADAVGQFFADRYGGVENLKRTMATDPVGFLSDVSVVMGGAGLAAAKVPKIANAASTVARAVDPIVATGKAVNAVGRGVGRVASEVLGVTTGAGGEAVRTAASAGYKGGPQARAVADAMRRPELMSGVVEDAKKAVVNLRNQRSAAYKAGMKPIADENKILNFAKIDAAVNDARQVGAYTGRNTGVQVRIDRSAQEALDKVQALVDEWRNLPPEDFHTAIGLDALKQSIDDVAGTLPYGSPARTAVGRVYNSVKDVIQADAPDYAKVMKGYEEATSIIKELETTLALKPDTPIDRPLRRLQSILRNNANTAYGRRLELAQMLQDAGAPHLMERLAGQGLQSWAPRGLARVGADVGLGMTAITHPELWPGILAGGVATSPRLVGEGALLGGRVAGATGKAVKPIPIRGAAHGAYQLDRTNPREELVRQLLPQSQ